MISSTYIIEALLLLSGALNSGEVPPNNHCDIENFLRANGCENLVPGFIAEEIEVRQINSQFWGVVILGNPEGSRV